MCNPSPSPEHLSLLFVLGPLLAIPAIHSAENVPCPSEVFKLYSRNATFSKIMASQIVETRQRCGSWCHAEGTCHGFSLTRAANGSLVCSLADSPLFWLQATSYESDVYTSISGVEEPAFEFVANGVVQNPQPLQYVTPERFACGWECRRQETCPGYSLTYNNVTGMFTCKLAPAGEDVYWMADNSSKLYLETPRSLVPGYTLVGDGRYYKVVIKSPLPSYDNGHDLCMRQGGDIMSFYPKVRTPALMAFMRSQPGGSQVNLWWFNGLGRGTDTGKLLLPALDIELTPSLTLDQPWENGVPTLSASDCGIVRFPSWSPTWDVLPCSSYAFYLGCMKQANLFKFTTNGEVEDPIKQRLVMTERECARICKLLGMAKCTGYSTTLLTDGSNRLLCKIPKPGEFFWTPSSAVSRVYTVPPYPSIGGGFNFAEDGRYYRLVATTLAQPSAYAACRGISGDLLAMPYPRRRTEKLAKLMRANGITVAWTGARGRTSDGMMLLDLSGEGFTPDVYDWTQVWDPTSPPPRQVSDNDCLVIRVSSTTNDVFWSLVSCTSTQPAYICEVSPPYFQIRSTGRWYRVANRPQSTYALAQEYCMREGGNLADTIGPDGLPTLNFALSQVLNNGPALICGIDEGSENQWKMCNGSSFSSVLKTPNQHWRNGQPNNNGGSENFLGTTWNASDGYKWEDVSNAFAAGFVGEIQTY